MVTILKFLILKLVVEILVIFYACTYLPSHEKASGHSSIFSRKWKPLQTCNLENQQSESLDFVCEHNYAGFQMVHTKKIHIESVKLTMK